MKVIGLILITVFIGITGHAQDNTACKKTIDDLDKKLTGIIRFMSQVDKIENRHISQLGEWMLELKELAANNSYGLFSPSPPTVMTCDTSFAGIFRNFVSVNYAYFFSHHRYPTTSECTRSFRSDLNNAEGMGKWKKLSFTLRAMSPLAKSTTLNPAEKEKYNAFHEYLYFETDGPGVSEFFYAHREDIQKATGFNPDPGTEDRTSFAKNFILSFRPHLRYYFGLAEEEYLRSSATAKIEDIRTSPGALGEYRRLLLTELTSGLQLVKQELNRLSTKCNTAPVTFTANGLKKTISYFTVPQLSSTPPVRPSDVTDPLPYGKSWVLITIYDANGRIYREYNDKPLISLYAPVGNNKVYDSHIRSSEYNQVAVGNYSARVSIAAYPQRDIVVEAGRDTRVNLRLGRLYLHPVNDDGTNGKQEIVVLAIENEKTGDHGATLTSTTVSNATKGGDSLNLAPGRYVVHTKYGVTETDTISIRAGECTRLTIEGHGKLNANGQKIEIRRFVPNATKLQWVGIIDKQESIQLPPGLYDISSRTEGQPAYRLQVESGHAYYYGIR